MDPVDLTQLLAQSQSFQGLHATDLQVMLQAARRRQVERDTFFFHQGDPITDLTWLERLSVTSTIMALWAPVIAPS